MNKKDDVKKTVDSRCFSLKELFNEKYTVDFYQREYVWQKKQLEDLINDLACAFLKCWNKAHTTGDVQAYDPYFMGEIIVAAKSNEINAIIDGQQRLTTLTLLLIYILHKFGNIENFPCSIVENAIYSDNYGIKKFNLDLPERNNCMLGLFSNGNYEITKSDTVSVNNIMQIYNYIDECWNRDINEENILNFTYWLLNKLKFSKVTTNNNDFAYIIFETMNDRGLSLTPVEMLRSYMLANIDDDDNQNKYLKILDDIIEKLSSIKLPSKSKAEMEFFKIYLRGHYAQDLSQNKDTSDFVKIGKSFHRWVRDSERLLNLTSSSDYMDFIDKIKYFSDAYLLIHNYINERDVNKYFYLIVNDDYDFTLQPALILSSLNYNDSDEIVEEKIQIVSKYITKVLTWRVWNHNQISQSSLESPIYTLCKKIRNKSVSELKEILSSDPIDLPELAGTPILNQQNKKKIKTLLALITEIVTRGAKEPSNYMLNYENIEIEHIWSDHFEEHTDEFQHRDEFQNMRNNIGDLLLLPKSFNSSYNDDSYEIKKEHYYSQNILAQSLHENKYINNPGFIQFVNSSNLAFKAYSSFKKDSILERATLYRDILLSDLKN